MSILFAAFLGYNPIQQLVGAHALAALPAASQATLVGRAFFPHLISAAFRDGLHAAFAFAIVACLIAAAASLMRGGKYHYAAPDGAVPAEDRGHVNGLSPGGVPAGAISQLHTREEQHAG